MDWKIELIHVPVSDVDRAKEFYVDKLGFNADHDQRVSDDLRFVQLTPPGSACSIAIGEGLGGTLEPGSLDVIQVVIPDADAVLSTAVDGFTIGTPLEVLTDGRDALVAIGMNGEPLPLDHGFPARLVVPGLYGYVSATKWLTEIELTRFDAFEGYWVPRGWSALGPIKTQSRIDRPWGRTPAGRTAIAGVAWAPTRGIERVEVRIDDDPWRTATLGPSVGDDSWRQWWIEWDATPGRHVLTCRATDGTGATQTDERTPVAPDGATGWHSVTANVE